MVHKAKTERQDIYKEYIEKKEDYRYKLSIVVN